MLVEIVRSGECGNSPKNAFAEEFAIALMTGDEKCAGWIADESVAIFPGGKAQGREAIIAAVAETVADLNALRIVHAITHGRVGAVNGELTGAGETKGFALILDFRNTKADSVAALRVYLA